MLCRQSTDPVSGIASYMERSILLTQAAQRMSDGCGAICARCPSGSDPGPVAAFHKQSISDDDPDQIGSSAGGSEEQELAAKHSCAQHLHKEQHFVRFDLI